MSRGRPKGIKPYAEVDAPLLAEIADLRLATDRSVHDIATQLATRAAGGGSNESKARRLARAYSEQQPALEREALKRKRLQSIEKAKHEAMFNRIQAAVAGDVGLSVYRKCANSNMTPNLYDNLIEAERSKGVVFGIAPYGMEVALREALKSSQPPNEQLEYVIERVRSELETERSKGVVSGIASYGLEVALREAFKSSQLPNEQLEHLIERVRSELKDSGSSNFSPKK